jgi:hypothetical protein
LTVIIKPLQEILEKPTEFRATGVSGLSVSNLTITGFGIGIALTSSTGTHITNGAVSNNAGDGIDIWGTSLNTTISGTTLEGNAHAIYANPCPLEGCSDHITGLTIRIRPLQILTMMEFI